MFNSSKIKGPGPGGSNKTLVVTDGFFDENPIVLEQTVAAIFELFLSICYNNWPPGLRPQEAIAAIADTAVADVLHMGDKYQSQVVREWAFDQLYERRFRMDPIQLVSLALKFQSKKIFPHGFRRLTEIRINDISSTSCRDIGNAVWDELINLRELLNVHRHIVACEPPFVQHSLFCSDQTTCSEDWRQVWWNGMGRCLLDGRNPQSYREAIERFERMQFGQMNVQCWRDMLHFIKERLAFQRADDLIREKCNELMETFIKEEPVT
ncbi:hypothetical protein BJ138DRAFT_1019193 [Hygrophoropsis aurantiaca]|uniref:Uncharacterized protein n=1 Tax=Hygrophoropsis aurantiaca TaxID=72124 RepID=A0ACB7ZTI7_9AGAM|nr:hypothetical protein BJ138DRAFT_1019193 [Hygrophoropsis aurantiaca]